MTPNDIAIKNEPLVRMEQMIAMGLEVGVKIAADNLEHLLADMVFA